MDFLQSFHYRILIRPENFKKAFLHLQRLFVLKKDSKKLLSLDDFMFKYPDDWKDCFLFISKGMNTKRVGTK